MENVKLEQGVRGATDLFTVIIGRSGTPVRLDFFHRLLDGDEQYLFLGSNVLSSRRLVFPGSTQRIRFLSETPVHEGVVDPRYYYIDDKGFVTTLPSGVEILGVEAFDC